MAEISTEASGTGQTTTIDASDAMTDRPAIDVTTMTMLVLAAIVLAFVGVMVLPDHSAGLRADTVHNWVNFAGRVAGDIARTVALLIGCVLISLWWPRVGRFVEQRVLCSSRRTFLATTAFVAFLLSALFSYFVLQHRPHVQDEIAMLFQAKNFAIGRLYAPTPTVPEFFDYEFIVVDGPRWYGKYFLGPSLVLMPGIWLGVPWLIHPLLAAGAVLLIYALGHELFNDRVARVAVVLFALSSFRTSVFALMMAHPACLVAMGLFTLAMLKWVRGPANWRWALLAGFMLGFAVNCRPVTAVAMGLPVAVFAAFRVNWRQFRFSAVAVFAGALLLWAAVFLGYNHVLTGHAMMTPFEKWCPADHLGFGKNVGLDYWREDDRGHSWSRALFRNGYLNLETLGHHLLGWGYVTFVLLLWPLVGKRWRWQVLLLASICGALIFAYLFYYTASVFAGQARYWSEAMPMMVLLAVVGMTQLRVVLPILCRKISLPIRAGRSACWLLGAVLCGLSVRTAYLPLIDECRKDYWGQSTTLEKQCDEQGITEGVILVKAHHYREALKKYLWDRYGSAFALNDPLLRGPLIFARDLGVERDAEVRAMFPGKPLYRIDTALSDAKIVPVTSLAASQPE